MVYSTLTSYPIILWKRLQIQEEAQTKAGRYYVYYRL